MKTLRIIKEQDIFPDAAAVDTSNFKLRFASRAVVHDDHGRIALLKATLRNFHKLPGGGLEPNEDKLTALKREVQEEIGCQIVITQEIGQTLEYRDRWQLFQTSYCYLARQVGEHSPPAFTEDELNDGFEVFWAENLETAIKMLESDKPNNYDGQHINPRDLTFLKTARGII